MLLTAALQAGLAAVCKCTSFLLGAVVPACCLCSLLQQCMRMQGVTAVPAAEVAESTRGGDSSASIKNNQSAEAVLNHAQSKVTDAKAEKEALERQINPKGGPTPVDLPPEVQKAADESSQADDAAMEGDDTPSGTVDLSTPAEVTAPSDESAPSPAPSLAAEGASSKQGADASTEAATASGADLDKSIQEDALKRQINPKGAPTPVALPSEAEKAAQVRRLRPSPQISVRTGGS